MAPLEFNFPSPIYISEGYKTHCGRPQKAEFSQKPNFRLSLRTTLLRGWEFLKPSPNKIDFSLYPRSSFAPGCLGCCWWNIIISFCCLWRGIFIPNWTTAAKCIECIFDFFCSVNMNTILSHKNAGGGGKYSIPPLPLWPGMFGWVPQCFALSPIS